MASLRSPASAPPSHAASRSRSTTVTTSGAARRHIGPLAVGAGDDSGRVRKVCVRLVQRNLRHPAVPCGDRHACRHDPSVLHLGDRDQVAHPDHRVQGPPPPGHVCDAFRQMGRIKLHPVKHVSVGGVEDRHLGGGPAQVAGRGPPTDWRPNAPALSGYRDGVRLAPRRGPINSPAARLKAPRCRRFRSWEQSTALLTGSCSMLRRSDGCPRRWNPVP